MQESNEILNEVTNGDYKYGFVTSIDTDTIHRGLDEETVRIISTKKQEPEWLLEFRLKALRYWQTLEMPTWGHLMIPPIDFQNIIYYAAPKKKSEHKGDEEIDPELMKTFDKLGIPLHVALWTNDIERLKQFYIYYFGGTSNAKYVNSSKGFCSYFLRFEGGAALEIMQHKDITEIIGNTHLGFAHIAFSLGSKERVNALTEQFRSDGYTVKGEPRTTGDGYYEAVILDPDGNIVELVG